MSLRKVNYILSAGLSVLLPACLLVASPVHVEAQTVRAATFSRTAVTGIGLEAKVSRRDPSDVIKVGDLYYVCLLYTSDAADE